MSDRAWDDHVRVVHSMTIDQAAVPKCETCDDTSGHRWRSDDDVYRCYACYCAYVRGGGGPWESANASDSMVLTSFHQPAPVPCDWCEEPMAPEDVRYFEAQEDMPREAVCGRCAEEWATGQVRPNAEPTISKTETVAEPAKPEAPAPQPDDVWDNTMPKNPPRLTREHLDKMQWELHLGYERDIGTLMKERDEYYGTSHAPPSKPFPPPPPRTTFDAPVAVGGPLSLSSRWR